MRVIFAAHVMDEPAATAFALCAHHLDPVARQHAGGRLIDRRLQDSLRAARHERDTALPLALRRRLPFFGGGWKCRQLKHRGDPVTGGQAFEEAFQRLGERRGAKGRPP